MNSKKEPTSMQQMLSLRKQNVDCKELEALFNTPKTSKLQLNVLQKSGLMENCSFAELVRCLERWNERGRQSGGSHAYHEQRNSFLLNALLRVAATAGQPALQYLQKVQKWYFNSDETEANAVLHKADPRKEALVDWQIRTSFKSALPTEINTYRRRCLFPQPIVCNPNLPSSLPQNGAAVLRKQHSELQFYREAIDFETQLKVFRLQKLQLSKHRVKDFYKKPLNRSRENTILMSEKRENECSLRNEVNNNESMRMNLVQQNKRESNFAPDTRSLFPTQARTSAQFYAIKEQQLRKTLRVKTYGTTDILQESDALFNCTLHTEKDQDLVLCSIDGISLISLPEVKNKKKK